MPKKILIIALVLALLAGGYFVIRAVIDQQARLAYAASPNKVADDFMHDLSMQDAKAAYDHLFSNSLKQGYSLDYWSKIYFPQFSHLAAAPKLISAGMFSQDAKQPSAYPQGLDVRQFTYQLQNQGVEYDLTLIILRKASEPWKIDAISGDYKAAQ